MQLILGVKPKFKIGDAVARKDYDEKLYVERIIIVNGQYHYYLFFDREYKKFCVRSNECILRFSG